MTRKSYKTVLRLKGIRPVRIERTVKAAGDVELLPVRGSIVHRGPSNVVSLSPLRQLLVESIKA